MTTGIRLLTTALLAWVLWMDQTVYSLSRESGSSGAEGATGQWTRLAVLPTKAACDSLRKERGRDADARDDAARRPGSYPNRYRFFCSPAVDETK